MSRACGWGGGQAAPGERSRRGFVPGQQQGHQLVADLDSIHRLAVLVAGLQQSGEHVAALVEVAGPASLIDLGVEQAVNPTKKLAHQRGPHAPRPEDQQQLARHTRCHRQRPHQFCPQLVKARPLAQPEHCAQDDLQRQRPHPRVQAHRLPARSAADLSLGDSGHRVGVGRQLVAADSRR